MPKTDDFSVDQFHQPSLRGAEPRLANSMQVNGFLREPQVLACIPFSRSTLWRRVAANTFPAPIKLSERVTAWRAQDVLAWMEKQTR